MDVTLKRVRDSFNDFSNQQELISELNLVQARQFMVVLLVSAATALPILYIFGPLQLMYIELAYSILFVIGLTLPKNINRKILRHLSVYLFELSVLITAIYTRSTIYIDSYKFHFSPIFIFFILYPIIASLFNLSLIKHYTIIILQIIILQFGDSIANIFSILRINDFELGVAFLVSVTYSMVISSAVVSMIYKRGQLMVKFEEDQKQLYRELDESKLKLFSIIAHDLKNPSGAIVGLSELLLVSIENKEKTNKLAKVIFESATANNELLNDLLAWSRSQLK